MDEQRFHELQAKARIRGLSDAEADELGRLYAEAEGKPYEKGVPTAAGFSTAELHQREVPRTGRRQSRRRPFRFWTSRSLEIGETAIVSEDAGEEDQGRAAPAA